jgi:hypothetical protein
VARPFLRGIVPAVVILFAVAGSGDSVGSGPTTSTGTQVTKTVPFVRESIDEIRALAPFREGTVPENRVIPFRRLPRGDGATGQADVPVAAPVLANPSLASSPAPLAPILDSSFAGLGNPPHGQDVIPPDTMGAAGPNHLVSLLNSDFGVFSKSGTLLQKVSLQNFWASLGTAEGEPANFPFDPKILYDQYSGRFVTVTLGGTDSPDSWVMVAVSSTSDPLDQWDKWAIDADRNNNVTQTTNSADYPGLGVDQFNIYITANMFDGNGGAQYGKVWVIPKPQLLTNPGATITWFEFDAANRTGFSRQPAHSFGASAAEYLVSEGSSSQLLLTRIDNASGIPVLHPPVPIQVASYVSSDSTPGAPQPGNDNTIDTADTRVLNAVYRNGSVWATHHVVGPGGNVEVAWYRIDPAANSGSGAVLAQGRIRDAVRWYYYPSIGVNQDNVAAIGFSGSSTVEFVGGYYTIIRPSSGIADPVSPLKSGEAPYYKTFTSGTNRWGDFSATMVDPSDDTSFWTLQEYADLPVSGISQWGTWWGKFRPSDVLSPTGLTATADNATQVTLRWTDPATNETGYVVERKLGAAGTFELLTSPPLPPDSVTYVDTVGLVAGTTYYYRVGAVGSTGTSFSIEVPVTTPGSPPSSGGGGGGGGCLSVARSRGGASIGSSLFSVGILLLPALALGLRRFSLRRGRTAPIRHPLC